MHPVKAKKQLPLILDESGASAVIIAIVFFVLCGAMGLAYDIGHVVMVKGQLQRTADAAALAGAMGFVPYNNPGTPDQAPNWVQGQQQAHTIINNAANQADSQIFTSTDGNVLYGYWLLNPPPDYVQLPLPTVRPANTAYLPEPAMMVTLSRKVTLYLAPLVGVSSPKTVSATAIAILPEAYTTDKIPPIAIAHSTYFNPDMTINLSEKDIKIQVQKDVSTWFNLDGTNDVPTTRIDKPITARKTLIYLQPGAKATLTDFMKQGDTITLPVVLDSDFNKSTAVPIETWCAFRIDQLDANSMTGHFVKRYFDPNVIPTAETGIISAVGGTPKLVSP
jgi:Flp pilus assembly protein TadG